MTESADAAGLVPVPDTAQAEGMTVAAALTEPSVSRSRRARSGWQGSAAELCAGWDTRHLRVVKPRRNAKRKLSGDSGGWREDW
jgi:hypothetical protein